MCSYFGELALLYDQPRAATVRATSKCKLWVMERSVYNTIYHQDVRDVRAAKLALVQSMPIFKALSGMLQGTLCDALQHCEHPANTALFYKGDEGHLFYLIKQGTVEITVGDKARSPSYSHPHTRCSGSASSHLPQSRKCKGTLEVPPHVWGSHRREPPWLLCGGGWR